MRNIKIIIQYDGSNYSGWQIQDNVPTIQGVIEKAIQKTSGEKPNLIGSGRTDAGVHSLGQVANFKTNSSIPADKFKIALNNNLPWDIRILQSEEVDINFHSRFDAKIKRYKYIISNSKNPNPINRDFSYNIERKLDIEEIKASLNYFVGTHDFESFMGPKSSVHTSIRTIYKLELKEDGEFIEIIIEGKSFLRYMIRIIVGTLIYVGLGKIKKDDIPKIIKSKDRRKAGPTVPAKGLFLERVYYGKNTLDIDKYIY